MCYLIVLCCFTFGGQRRQIVTGMNLNVIYLFNYIYLIQNIFKNNNNDWFIKPPPEKIERLQVANGIAIPKYIGELLEYYRINIRPILLNKSNVVAFWINNNKPISIYYV